MQLMLSLVLLASIIDAAKSQIWVGTYTMEPGCSPTQCCCFQGQVTVTRPSTEFLEVRIGITGQCGGETIYHNRNIPYPNGFEVPLPINGDVVELTLSSDSRFVTGNSPNYPACNSKAVKNGAIKQHMNIAMPLFALVLLQLIANFF